MQKKNWLIILIIAVLAALAEPFKWYWRNAVASNLFVKTAKTQAAHGLLAYQPIDAEITVTNGAAGATAGTDTIAIQFKGANGEDIAEPVCVFWYLSTDAYGQTLATNSTDVTTWAIGTDGTLIEQSANVYGMLICETDGDADIAAVIPSGKTVYLNLVMPSGRLITSDAITYTT